MNKGVDFKMLNNNNIINNNVFNNNMINNNMVNMTNININWKSQIEIIQLYILHMNFFLD